MALSGRNILILELICTGVGTPLAAMLTGCVIRPI